jgi:hypothetical protein
MATKWCILLAHYEGGSYTILANTREECIERCKDQCKRWPKSYICATLPYEVVPIGPDTNICDTSIPAEWREDLGADIMKTYLSMG